MGETLYAGPQQGVVVLIEAIKRTGASDVEFGYFPLNGSDDEPKAYEACRWWAKAKRDGLMYSAERVTNNHAWGVLEVLTEVAHKLGSKINVSYEG